METLLQSLKHISVKFKSSRMTRCLFPCINTSSSLYFLLLSTRNHTMETVCEFSFIICMSIKNKLKQQSIQDLGLQVVNYLRPFPNGSKPHYKILNHYKKWNYRDGQPSFFDTFNLENIQRDSIAGTLTTLRNSWVRIPAEAIYFSHLQRVQNGYGAQLVRGFFPGVNKPRREVDHSPPFCT